MSYLEIKYINLLSSKLRNFKRKSEYLFNCSCIFCGDSKQKNKARFYFIQKKNKWFCYCHNCSWKGSFSNTLKKIDNNLYSEYLMEKQLNHEIPIENFKIETKKIVFKESVVSKLETVKSLPDDHPCKKYVIDRQIPEKHYSLLKWSPYFFKWVNSFLPGKFDTKLELINEGRLILPFYNKNNDLHAILARSIEKNSYKKYILLNLDENIPCIFGLKNIDWNKNTYIVEGPLDSLFLDNSVALCRLDFNQVKDLCRKDKSVFIFDNEPRSIYVKQKMIEALNLGFNIVVWPKNIKEKDINDMIIKGLTTENLYDIINKSTYKGLNGILAISSWAKV